LTQSNLQTSIRPIRNDTYIADSMENPYREDIYKKVLGHSVKQIEVSALARMKKELKKI